MSEEHKKSERAKREEEILAYWKENTIFQKTLGKQSPKGDFVFYEGPPTANGRPGIHHLESRAFKDAITRYKTMCGFHVRRKAGWDTHGLPVELEVEKELDISSKREIEEYGIGRFNEKSKESVWKYVDEWRAFTERIGYWLDLDDPYITYSNNYVESVWWVFSEIADKGLLYKDYKVVPWCPRCGTTLSSHELAQGYETVKDLSLTVKFQITGDTSSLTSNLQPPTSNLYLLAWTTTPWTLPGNVALAVNPSLRYIVVKVDGEHLILAKELADKVLERKEYEIKKELQGKELVGLSYKPLYPYLSNLASDAEGMEKAFKVYEADFVTTEEGTGIVHTAVMYGQDDFELGDGVGLPKFHLVNEDGHFIEGTDFLSGRFVKNEETDVEIIKDLHHRGLLFDKKKYEHSYPHCWRCKTPLIYYARDSWYIRTTDIKEKLIAENQKIHWEPAHIKDGRFGEWLSNLRDWAVSRERYWGTPLPVWQATQATKHETRNPDAPPKVEVRIPTSLSSKRRRDTKQGELEANGERLEAKHIVIGSYDELAKKTKSTNNFLLMRHGEAENNTKGIVSSKKGNGHMLTEKGRIEARRAAGKLASSGVDLILTSPFLRTRETAEIMGKELGVKVQEEGRLSEIDTGAFNGKPNREYHAYFDSPEEKFEKRPPEGESLTDLKRRVGELLYELEEQYDGKTILLVSHEYPLWMLTAAAQALDIEKTLTIKAEEDFMGTAEVRELHFSRLPHNDDFEFDPHRPYIDEVSWVEDGVEYRRTPEVMDVWFDSGAMPFAQDHYPFDFAQNKPLEAQELSYPADFISEAIDQTRGWFYTLHAVGNLLGRGRAYNNVISLGLILDAEGQKMSKSKGNAVNPWEAADKWGVDVLRFWMYSVNQPGESKNFDLETVDEVNKKVFNLLENILRFYEMFASDEAAEVQSQKSKAKSVLSRFFGKKSREPKSSHVLDAWIVAKLNQLIQEVTDGIESYDLFTPTRAIRDFIADFSQWYIRRSRSRFKKRAQNDADNPQNDAENRDAQAASRTTRYVLLELSKLLAPFAPFMAEHVYRSVGGRRESVHLESWPKSQVTNHTSQVIADMKEVRRIVSLAFEARDKEEIKVRQPLVALKIKKNKTKNKINSELLRLIKDEVNVKEIIFDEHISDEVELDTTVTPELKSEGQARDLVRAIQRTRKKKGLSPEDNIILTVETSDTGKQIINEHQDEITSTAGIKEINHDDVEGGEELDLHGVTFNFSIHKL